MKKLKSIEIFNIIFLIFVIISDFCYMKINTSEYITKTIASVIFVAGGAVNLFYALKHKSQFDFKPNFKYWLMAGLFSAMLGDILLIDFFVAGVIFFALGHVLYFIAFCTITRINWLDIIVGCIIFILSACVILFYKHFEFAGLKFVILIYALIISMMVGKTISNLIRDPSAKNTLLVLGSVLFFLSDLMLLFRRFGGAPILVSDLCLIFYYPAEFLLAYSIYYVSKNNLVKEN